MGPTELQPLPPGLALALESDDLSGWPLLAAGCGPSLFSWTDNEHHVQARSLLSLACYYGAEECVATLLGLPSGRASASEPSPTDGSTPLHCACSRPCDATYRILTRLIASGADCGARDGAGRRAGELLIQSKMHNKLTESGCKEDSELCKPEYRTDNFRMYHFKIDPCPRVSEDHDWIQCPYSHPDEKARRRDPRHHHFHGVPCPDFRKGSCKRGESCPFAHGVFECWMHPTMYRTQLCKEGLACRRAICFFAHSLEELRQVESSSLDRCSSCEALGGAKVQQQQRLSPTGLAWGLNLADPESPVSHLMSRSQSVSSTESVMSRQPSGTIESLYGSMDLAQSWSMPGSILDTASLNLLLGGLRAT